MFFKLATAGRFDSSRLILHIPNLPSTDPPGSVRIMNTAFWTFLTTNRRMKILKMESPIVFIDKLENLNQLKMVLRLNDYWIIWGLTLLR